MARLAASFLVLLFLTACGGQPGESVREEPVVSAAALAPVLADDEFSVLSFHLDAYGYQDRSGDGQATDAKPAAAQAAVIGIIADVRPEILAVQDMGGGEVFAAFRQALADAGLAYPFAEIADESASDFHLAVLSQYPITSSQAHVAETYSVGEAQVPVQRGFLEVDISIRPTYAFRLIVAQLKSKVYHPLGHTEMRRSEARLLNNLVREALDRSPRLNLLVVGNMNDHVGAAPLRMIMGSREQYLKDLRPTDGYGEIWTYFDAENEVYHRYDYLLASPHMASEYVAEKSGVIRHPLNLTASTRRPLLAVFRARDVDPDALPLLPAYEEGDE
jgi:hypothetical protein